MAIIFVTGASGFLGNHLCGVLRQLGHELVTPSSRDCDLRRLENLHAFSNILYDRIIHLAAWTQAGDFCLRHPGEQWIINQQINTNMLGWWQKEQPQALFVSIGTSCAYAPDLPLTENNYLEGRPIESLFTYAMTKRMLFAGLQAFRSQFKLDSITLVPSTLYGPGYHTDGRQMHFIFDLIRKILRGHLFNEPVILWGDGHQKRELVHVNDFVNIAIKLMDNPTTDLVNIGAGTENSIREFASIICQEIGYDPANIHYDTRRYVGARSKILNISRLHSLIPELKLTPLKTGIAQTLQWFLENRDHVLNSPQLSQNMGR